MNEKVDIVIGRRRLTVDMESLTPIEINALAQRVDDRMNEIGQQNKSIADTSKLAILTALDFAAELQKLRDARSIEQAALERKIEELNLSLRTALAVAGKK